MKKFAVLSCVFVLVFGLSGVASAYSIDTTFVANGNEFTSPFFATVENFNTGTPLWTWTGSFEVVSGSVSGKYSAPSGVDGINKDITPYVTVPKSDTGGSGSVAVTGLPSGPGPGGTYNYFGLWWGSIDTYNTFRFTLDGNLTGEFVTGSTVLGVGTPSGDQLAAGSNHYVNFLGLKAFNGFIMESTQFAFEADNIALGYNPTRVPEPITMLLLGLGLVGLAGVRRFKK